MTEEEKKRLCSSTKHTKEALSNIRIVPSRSPDEILNARKKNRKTQKREEITKEKNKGKLDGGWMGICVC